MRFNHAKFIARAPSRAAYRQSYVHGVHRMLRFVEPIKPCTVVKQHGCDGNCMPGLPARTNLASHRRIPRG